MILFGVITGSGNTQKVTLKQSGHWVNRPPDFNPARRARPRTDFSESLENHTARMIVHTTIGSSKVKVKIP
jgi:hypothetical protein